MIDMNDILKIINDNRIDGLVEKLKFTNKLSQQLVEKNEICIENYNLAIPYLIKYPTIIEYENILVEEMGHPKPVPSIFSIKFSKDGITRESPTHKFMCGSRFRQFTQITEITKDDKTFALMHAVTRECVYEPLSKALTEDGNEIFNKLVDKHKSLMPPTTAGLKRYYNISNITGPEKIYFNIITNNARLYFKSYGENVMPFISNGQYLKDTPFPTFNYRVFLNEKGVMHKYPDLMLPEKMFVLNHYEDVSNAVNSYYNFIEAQIKKHLDFFEYANTLVERYAVLGKL